MVEGGDEVVIIQKRNDTAWIVESKTAERFTVNPDKLM